MTGRFYMPETEEFIRAALKEDIGTGDITTNSVVSPETEAHGRFVAKEEGVVCGLELIEKIYHILDKNILVELFVEEGTSVKKGDLIAQVSGNARNLLAGERLILNLVQHMSGIATATRKAVDSVKGTRATITDTRKTTPLMRVFEKYAVRVGGGKNHRFGLQDGVLIKDNHIVAAGGIGNAIRAARENIPHTLKIEVETETLQEVQEALDACKAEMDMALQGF